MMFGGHYVEPHSPDGRSYIEGWYGSHRWRVWFDGVHRATFKKREWARLFIRYLKGRNAA